MRTPFSDWVAEVMQELTRLYEDACGKVRRTTSAPFIDARFYYDRGYTATETAKIYLSLSKGPSPREDNP